MKDLKNLILGTTIYDGNFIPYLLIAVCLVILGCIVYVVISFIKHLRDEKQYEILRKINMFGLGMYYEEDKKGRLVDKRERKEKEKAKAKKREDRKNKLKLLKSKLKLRK